MSLKHHSYCSLLTMLILLFLAGCTPGQAENQVSEDDSMQMAPQVEIVTVQSQPFTDSVELPGRILAKRVAEVRARVAGIVLKRHFEEGSDVNPDQPLFSIEPVLYEAELAKAKADVAKVNATLYQMQAEVDRANQLIKVKAISQQEYDTAVANVEAAKASLLYAKAEVKSAELSLSYTEVKAPINGRIGAAKISEGALVGQGEATVMATIRQLNPIYVDFTQPVSEYLKLKKTINNNGRILITTDDPNLPMEGRFLFSEVNVDRSTGQVTLRGEFPNPDRLLLPNMFVRVLVELETNPETIFIPQRAVLRQPKGSAGVMIVDKAGTTRLKPVKTGRMIDGNWQILEGLQSGEKIVASNVGQITPGMQLPKEEIVSQKDQLDTTTEQSETITQM